MVTFPITELELGVLAHESHPLSKEPPKEIVELLAYPWIIYSQDPLSTRMISDYFARHGLQPPEETVCTTSFEFCLEMVTAGEFITPAATRLAQTYDRIGIKSVALPELIFVYPIGAYVRESSLELEVISRLLELLKRM